MMLASAFALMAFTSAAPLPRAVVVVRATGFAEADAAKLEEKANNEVAERGFEAQRMNDPDAACWSARACARDLVRNAGAIVLARIDFVRGGGNVQIAAVLFDDEGRASDEVTSLARVTALLGDDAVLPPAFLSLLAAKQPQISANDAPVTRQDPPVVTPEATASDASPAVPHEPGEPGAAQPLSGVALAAIGGIGVGALAIAVGAVGATGQVRVARDPTALGADKERAAVLVPVLAVVAVAGIAIAGASGWVLVGELD